MSLKNRVERLESWVGQPEEECPGPVTFFQRVRMRAGESEPDPPIPEDAAPCPRCGKVHALLIIEEVVTTRAEALAARKREGLNRTAPMITGNGPG
jgi:hypothetical protein